MYQDIKLTEIRPNPANPRREFEGRKFDELMDSIRSVGVIEPVLVRPIPDQAQPSPCQECDNRRALANKTKGVKIPGGPGKCIREGGLCENAPQAGEPLNGDPAYELIAGERRWRASLAVAEENGGPDHATIPAIIKNVDDDTAFDLMTIENLQRADLTELEEAQGFKTWVERKGQERITELAERCGLSPRYIRRRLAVLDLPQDLLDAWHGGQVRYGHLEQMLRCKNDAELYGEILGEIFNYGATVADVRRFIDKRSRDLSKAVFDIQAAGCPGCQSNTETQKKLFDLGGENACCLDPDCYRHKLGQYFRENWDRIGKQYGTNGFRFCSELSLDDFARIWSELNTECRECNSLVTLFWEDGEVRMDKVCIGPVTCYNKLYRPTTTGTKSESEKDPDQPRVKWHGTYFREEFYQDMLQDRLETFDADSDTINRLVLFAFLRDHRGELREWFGKRHGAEEDSESYYYYMDTEKLYKIICGLDAEIVLEEIKAAAIQATMQTEFGNQPRHMMAELAGVDLATEWRITEDYLQKKTKAEILILGKIPYGGGGCLFDTHQAQEFLEKTLGVIDGRFDKLKKPDLIRVFTESGADLAGLVPDEILRADEYNPGGFCG